MPIESVEIPSQGTIDERKLFTELFHHYQLANDDLTKRRVDFDRMDVLFRSHIEEGNWPYRSIVFDPRVFTALYEKTSRIFANKPRGRMIPREGGDTLGAKINNELLSFQWDDNERVDGTPMLAKWALMDLTARKYGASFALVKWHYERKFNKKTQKSQVFYDAPNFIPLNNRDCLPNPSYSTIKNWFQERKYITLQELRDINDAARSKPIYKNLDLLKTALVNESIKGGDMRSSNYVIKNKSIRGLEDVLGRDETFKILEIITEYRKDRWITFSPKHGVILRDIPNPYNHGQIPVVMLKYYPVDDDLYGLSEIEPVEKIQKAINAILCQYLDAVNISLYPITKVRSTGGAVQMHTLEFGPGKKWLMSDPASDVLVEQSKVAGVTEFTSTYRFLVGAMQEALGETSASVSNLVPGGDKKTATEVRDLAASRSVRDNFNQLFLAEALKKQYMFWHTMNQQFLFSNPQERVKIIRIVGKEAIKYFQQQGLDGEGLTQEAVDTLTSKDTQELNLDAKDFLQPLYPVTAGGETIPKFSVEEGAQTGSLVIEPEDLTGNYDYIPDIDSMRVADDAQLIQARQQLLQIALNPITQQLLAQEQYQVSVKELLEDTFELMGVKDADKYFEKLEVNQFNAPEAQGQTQPSVQRGTGRIEEGELGLVNGQQPGISGGVSPLPGDQTQSIIP